ncbi:MAG: DUF2807 domain-containing protein [Actinobacteria bacterium]|nr:DUF2807 domain-containing protein [Actinomycetota bacterium]
MNGKNMQNKTYFKKSLSTFLIIIVLLLSAMISVSCIKITGLKGSGNIESQDRSVSGFDSVSVSSGISLYIEQSGTESLLIEAEDNVLSRIITEVKNEELIIRYKPWIFSFGGINVTEPVKVYLGVKNIESIKVSSGSSFYSSSISAESIDISLSSGSNGEATIDVKELKASISSGSKLIINGKAQNQDISLSSGVAYKAYGLKSDNARLDASSGSVAEINVSKSLDVNVSSGAEVNYKGTPQVISDISSGGSLNNE